MGQIQALSAETIHKIAAGEVIERPANVVKELVENSLDAGATKIRIQLEDGGKQLIRVSDDGSGMRREDAEACFLAHTTSKIRKVEDLEEVVSFGFRGEALCSMGSVSQLSIETRHRSDETGVRVRVGESRLEGVEPISRNPGTTISVVNLFLNNPVRRKFLGSARSETQRIVSALTRMALSHPQVDFSLAEGKRELLRLPEGSLKRRAGDVLGMPLARDFAEIEYNDGEIAVQGFVAEPPRFASRSTQQHFFVNRRNVWAPAFTRALGQSFDNLPPGKHPIAVLFVTLAPENIDVNIHPTKREIRFLHEGRVVWAVAQAVRQALRRSLAVPAMDLSGGDEDAAPVPFAPFAPSARSAPATPISVGPAGKTPASRESASAPGAAVDSPDRRDSLAFPETASHAAALTAGLEEAPTLFPAAGTHAGNPAAPSAAASQASSFRAEESPAAPLQLHRRFLLVAVRGGYLLLNQQAAHERILYERALEDLNRSGRAPSQQLLFPELMEFSPAEARLLEVNLDRLGSLGFELDPFGARTYQLRGLPPDVGLERAREALGVLLEELGRGEADGHGAKGSSGAEELQRQRLAKAYARAAAVPLGMALESAQMSALVDGLFATRNPYVSPRGAPAVIRTSLAEIHRKFGLPFDPEG